MSNLSVASGKTYQVMADLVPGDVVYTDRSYTYSTLPSMIAGSTYIQTANDDKNANQASFLSFSVNQNVTVFVAYDSRASSLPNWLTSWTATGEILGTSDVPLSLYSRSFSGGSVSLGGNLAAGASGAGSNYSIMVTGQGGSSSGPWNGEVAFEVRLQGWQSGMQSWSMPFDLILYTPASAGPTTEVSAFTPNTGLSTDEKGVLIVDVTPGTYDIWVKGENVLGVLLKDVDLNTGPVTPISLGYQLGGDVNGDNAVDDTDYAALLAVLGKATSSLTPSERLNDHNRDGIVDIVDYVIVVQNFGRFGDPRP